MKVVYKLWHNAEPKKKSTVHKGYSILVEVNHIDMFYLNFYKPDNWAAITFAPRELAKSWDRQTTEFNQPFLSTNNPYPCQIADFTAKGVFKNTPMFSAILNTRGATPTLMFMDWDGETDIYSFNMMKNIRGKSNRSHAYYYQDDYDQLGFVDLVRRVA